MFDVFYRTVFGSMNARAYEIMEENKKKVTRSLMTKSREKEILKEADSTIQEILALHATLKERKKLEDKEMDEALAAAKKDYKGLYFPTLFEIVFP